MSKKPSVPKGTRDFSPTEVAKRNYIMETIKSKFQLYGFQPIETPSFENSETLLGKYGEEGDRLIFKILNSGDYFNLISYYLGDFSKITLDLQRVEQNINNKNLNSFSIDDEIDEIKERLSVNSTMKEAYINLIRELYNKNPKLFESAENMDSSGFQDMLLIEIIDSKSLTKEITPKISEKALRYDLTVPFARYVVQHQNEITFPFKRYQMQPVWRADRPQKGRFREFWQCDADVVGSDSLWQEIELVQLYDDVFNQLNLHGITIKINNRKILSGIAEVIGAEDKLIDFTVALDKLDKIGEEGVIQEMKGKGIESTAIDKLKPLFTLSGGSIEKLSQLKQLLFNSKTGMEGIDEVEFVVNTINELGLKASKIELDVTLARGLDYYTGAIFEVTAPQGVNLGSIGGGGRYDDLTGIFGLKGVSGVGISFGLDRIYLVFEELGLFPKTVEENTKVLFINFGNKESLYAQKAIYELRKNNIASELYPDSAKMGKQMTYADKRAIPFVVLAGESELNSNNYTLKNMTSGEQQSVDLKGLVEKLK